MAQLILNSDEVSPAKWQAILSILSTADRIGKSKRAKRLNKLSVTTIIKLVGHYLTPNAIRRTCIDNSKASWKNIYRYFVYLYAYESLSLCAKSYRETLGATNANILQGWRAVCDWCHTDVRIRELIADIDVDIHKQITTNKNVPIT